MDFQTLGVGFAIFGFLGKNVPLDILNILTVGIFEIPTGFRDI